MERGIENCRIENPAWSEAEIAFWVVSKQQLSLEVFSTVGGLPSLQDSFPKITARTLILKADTDEEEQARLREVADLLPSGKMVFVSGAGHNIRRDQPEATLRLVRDFLTNL